jgi:preprotein translocase subunit SecD
MYRFSCPLATWLIVGSTSVAWGQDKTPQAPNKLPDGVYEVLRDSLKEKGVLPLKDGEVLVVQHHRYSKPDAKEPPRFLVVHPTPAVQLDLADSPKTVRQGEEVVRILLKLQPKAAKALERLTSDCLDRQITIVLCGEVVTMHKVRQVIRDGDVQITSCAAGAANYLLEQLQARQKGKGTQ